MVSHRIEGQGEAGRLADESIAPPEAGFRAMKVRLGYGLADDLAGMAAVGRGVEGRGVTLTVDTSHAYGVGDAVRLGLALAPYDLRCRTPCAVSSSQNRSRCGTGGWTRRGRPGAGRGSGGRGLERYRV